MKDEVKFNIEFVKAIEKHEILYNHALKEYGDKEEQERGWELVANQMNESVASCKGRWKNLRASLCRHLRNLSPGASDNFQSKKPYYLADHMHFVIPFIKCRLIQKGQHSSTAIQYSDSENMDTEILQEFIGSPTNEEMPNTSFESRRQSISQTSNFRSLPDDGNSIASGSTESLRISYKSSGSTAQEEDDEVGQESFDALEKCAVEYRAPAKPARYHKVSEGADLSFLRSIIPDMKKMDGRQKNRFKRQILRAIDDILYKKGSSSLSDSPSP